MKKYFLKVEKIFIWKNAENFQQRTWKTLKNNLKRFYFLMNKFKKKFQLIFIFRLTNSLIKKIFFCHLIKFLRGGANHAKLSFQEFQEIYKAKTKKNLKKNSNLLTKCLKIISKNEKLKKKHE